MAVLLAQCKGLQIKRQSLGAFPSTHTLQHSTPNSLGSLVSWDHFKIGVGSRQPNKRARKTYGSWQIRAPKAESSGSLARFPSHFKVPRVSLWYESFSPCWNANTKKQVFLSRKLPSWIIAQL